jgi:hypothetical protein
LIPLLLIACAAPDLEFNHHATVQAHDSQDSANQAFLDVFERATTELRVALPSGTDETLTDALIAANDRGVDVLVVTDVDQVADPGFVALSEAGIAVTYGDGAVGYFDFNSNADVGWTSDQVILSSAFTVADKTWFAGASRVGGLEQGQTLTVSGQHNDLADDLWTEHVQLYGGIDCTALTAFSAPAKSIADIRWRYGTGQQDELEMWLGPQQRLTKRVIDATYAARRSVWILTDELANDGLARALQEKAADGFDVQVIVGPRFGTSEPALSREFEDRTPDVVKYRIDAEYVPTVVIVDAESSGTVQGRALFLTHDLYSAARLNRGSAIVSDQLIDGLLWQIDTWNGEPSRNFEEVLSVWTSHLDQAGDFE